MSEVWTAFRLADKQFTLKYGFPKPSPDSAIYLYCLKGKRADDAADKLSLIGFNNVIVYRGSFADWKANGGDVETGEEERGECEAEESSYTSRNI